jgi:hypothetical protein
MASEFYQKGNYEMAISTQLSNRESMRENALRTASTRSTAIKRSLRNGGMSGWQLKYYVSTNGRVWDLEHGQNEELQSIYLGEQDARLS